MNSVLVSISCITYNHAPFIRECLDGFLMQKCNFDYEILIHDDASTDGTQDIISEYQEKYPEIIKPILQKENQYSKGFMGRMNASFNFPRARGKYIALCEGDDYWTDPLKLQKQVDLMMKYKSTVICGHQSYTLNIKTNEKILKYYSDKIVIDQKFTNPKLLSSMHTSSLLLQKKLLDNMPEFFMKAPTGDFSLRLYMASQGKISIINQPMSIYRKFVPNSYTNTLRSVDGKAISITEKQLIFLDKYNRFTKYKYNSLVKSMKRNQVNSLLFLLKLKNENKLFLNSMFRYYKILNLASIAKAFIIFTFGTNTYNKAIELKQSLNSYI